MSGSNSSGPSRNVGYFVAHERTDSGTPLLKCRPKRILENEDL